jgi:hypothetical protein
MMVAATQPSMHHARRTMARSRAIATSLQDAKHGWVERTSECGIAPPLHAPKSAVVGVIAKLFEAHNFLPFHQIAMHTGLSEGQIVRMKPDLEALLRKSSGNSSHVCVTSRVDVNPRGLFLED